MVVAEGLLRALIREQLEAHRVITEGGAYGHVQHLYELRDATFDEILDILRVASEGKLENVTEKTDGINMMFSLVDGTLRVATNASAIPTGGMDRDALAAKYKDKEGVQNAYLSGYDALADGLSSLTDKERLRLFGNAKRRVWYSVEVIASALPGTIRYGGNILSVHMNGATAVLPDGSTEPVEDPAAALEVGRKLAAIGKSGDWKLAGATLVEVPAMSSEAYDHAASRIAGIGASGSETVQEYLVGRARKTLAKMGLAGSILEQAANKLAGSEGTPNLTLFKSKVPADVYALMQDSKGWQKEAVLPLEEIITDFAVERLSSIESVLVSNSSEEVARLRSQVDKAISAIESSGDETAMQVLQREMVKLKSVENIVSPMEGIVFRHKGKILKLTGAFSSFHQILSLFKFGRKGTKLSMESRGPRRMISEGGHALADVGPVTLTDLDREYPKILKFLAGVGIDKVAKIGTTGKKKVMGDVDLAVETDMSIEDLTAALVDELGPGAVRRLPTTVSFAWDFGSGLGQVDLMLGKLSYLSWSRFGPDPKVTPFKGLARNVLLNALARVLSAYVFTVPIGSTERKRYAVDFDKGLFVNTQTKLGKNGKPLGDWKTTSRDFVTDDPDEIVAELLGDDITADQVLTFEDLMVAIGRSRITRGMRSEIASELVDRLEQEITRRPNLLGPDTAGLMRKIAKDYAK